MKNNNSIIGLALIGLAFGLLYLQNKQIREKRSAQEDFIPPAVQQEVVTENTDEGTVVKVEETEVNAFSSVTEEDLKVPEVKEISSDITLQNDFISVDFTKTGGAIKEIRFLKTKRGGLDDFVFNKDSLITALQLSRREADGSERLLNYTFNIVRSDENSVLFEYDTGRGVKFVRSYTLDSKDGEQPYAIKHATSIVNSSTSEPIKIGSSKETELLLTLGTTWPVESDKRGEFQAFAYYNGEDEFIKSSYFTGSKGFMGMGAKPSQHEYSYQNDDIQWAAVKNQFFVSVFTPEKPGTSVYAHSTRVLNSGNQKFPKVGIVGKIGFKPGIVAPNSESKLSGIYYVGPKQYNRLVQLGDKQDKLMQFGFFGAISKILLSLMYFIQGYVGNWGVAIILMTTIVKLVFWPLTSYSAQSSKKMQLLQEPMKEIREKYQDKPERMQRETMELFKKYGVNPLAGCLPMLIQIPIFLGLYWMLRTSADLRYEPFLWVSDLSKSDTVATIAGFPLNIMPLLNGAAMFIQMQMTPMSPTADPNQQRIMKIMPIMFLFIMYSFSSGLVLYWTVNAVLSIIQTQLVYRKKENLELKPVMANAAQNKPVGKKQLPNRSPKRKK